MRDTNSNETSLDAGMGASDNASPDTELSIHVLSGLHEGATAPIAEGACLIGSAGHCEIVLSDRGFAAEQLLLVRTGRQTRLHVLGPATTINGEPAPSGARLKIEPGAVITVAGTRLGFGTDNQPWDSDVKAAVAGASFLSAGESLGGSRAALGIFALVAALAAGLVTQVYLRAGDTVATAPSGDERFAELRKALSDLNEPELALTRGPDGEALVAGYVGNLTALQRLNRVTAGSGARVSVYAADELVRYANEMIRSRDLHADVSYIGRGKLRIAGQENDLGSLKALANEIRRELPGLQGLEDEITAYYAEAPKTVTPAEDAYVLSGINGVNSGHKVPYISSGDNYIFTGGVLGNGMSVIAIEPSRVLVDDRGNKRTTEVLVQ